MLSGEFQKTGQKVLSSENGLGEVWISGYDFAHNVDELQKHKIAAVCAGLLDNDFRYPQDIKNIKFDLDDQNGQKVDHAFDPAYQFLQSHRKNTNVLIYCKAGISRCSMLLASYMMRKYNMDYETCIAKIKAARPSCQPNAGFVEQLKEYQINLGIKA